MTVAYNIDQIILHVAGTGARHGGHRRRTSSHAPGTWRAIGRWKRGAGAGATTEPVQANEAVRNTIVPTATLRYGLTNRIELEARLPYLFRSDRVEVVKQREGSITRALHLSEQHVGDAELALRYQLNRASGERPIWIASLRVKMPTGKGPFDIPFDESGVAQGLATGSGFWAVQPGLSFLLPSDPDDDRRRRRAVASDPDRCLFAGAILSADRAADAERRDRTGHGRQRARRQRHRPHALRPSVKSCPAFAGAHCASIRSGQIPTPVANSRRRL